MKTLSFAILSLVAAGALAGCNTPIETEDTAGPEAARAPAAARVDLEVEAVTAMKRLQFKHSGLCIGAAAGVNGSPLVQKDCGSTDATIVFEKEYATSSMSPPRPPTQFRLRYAVDRSLCVHIGGPSFDDGGLVALYTCDPARDNQWFNEDPIDAAGFGGIRAVHSDLCLAAFGSLTNVGSSVYQWGTPCSHDWQQIRQYL
ncbi:MAG: ricin-type beta-trefoil lectin domain protein [Minicystis sp.]